MSDTEKIPFLDLKSPHAGLRDELSRMFLNAVDTGGFVGGPEVAGFEKEFAEYVGAKFAVGVSNGTDALRFALLAMGIGPGSLAVTVPNTFIATTEAISQTGATFEFVDVDSDSCLMSPGGLEDLLKKRFGSGRKDKHPCAVVPVHLYGQCAEMDAILELAKKYELKTLEDAAQAHGATYRGRKAGGMGDAAAFSFYPGKNLGAIGEGGAVTTNDAAIAEKVRILRDHGQKTKYYHSIEGWNGRLDAIQAGALRIKLRRLDEWNAARAKAAEFYDAGFAGLGWVRPVKVAPHCFSCRHLYVIHVSDRDALREWLEKRNIGTGMHYPAPLHLQECYRRLGYGVGSFPNAERSARELLSLPMFPGLTVEQLERVVRAVRDFGASRGLN